MDPDYSDYSDYYKGNWDGPCEPVQNQSLSRVLGPYVHSVMCFLGLIGNGLMLLTLLCSKRPPSVTQTLLVHLAVADLVLVLVLPGLVVMDLGVWPEGGGVACKLLKGGYSLSLFSSAFLLAAVGADRYAAVVHARRRLRARSSGLSRVVGGAVWVAAVTLSLPAFIYYNHYVPEHHTQEKFNYSHPDPDLGLNLSHLDLDLDFEQLWLNDSTPDLDSAPGPAPSPAPVCDLQLPDGDTAVLVKVLIPALQLTVGFLIPLLLMSFCYGSVLHTLLRGRGLCCEGRGLCRQGSGERRGSGKGGQGFRRERAVRLVLLVALVFILCHTPYNVILTMKTTRLFKEQDCESWDRLEFVLALSQTLALLHCVLNPLLYGFNSAPFRTAFCGILHKLHPQRRLSSTTSQSERSTHYTL